MQVELLKNPRDSGGDSRRGADSRPAATTTCWWWIRSAESTVAQRRQVTIGGRRPGEVEILDGLEAGEFVVVDGTLRTRPGQPVTVIAVDKATNRWPIC
jgi:membrane fusion protein (multidrug efflux system)